jgi:two-component system, OmpR family, phosphate regulon sensor histidine kinase PhoR
LSAVVTPVSAGGNPAALVGITLVAIVAIELFVRARLRARRLQELAARARAMLRTPQELPFDEPDDDVGAVARAVHQLAADLHTRLAALERDRAERERIIGHMSDGVALLDVHGRVLRANASMASLVGATLPPAPGTPFHEFVRAPELDELVARARRDEQSVDTDLRLWTSPPRVVRATATPFGAGRQAGILLLLHDLTEEERVNRMRQDFVANVSHELRTPLTSLRGYAETLLEGGLEDVENRRPFVQVIRDQAVRLAALVDDLLSLAELERPGAEVRRARFDLRELAEQQVAMFQPRARDAGLHLDLEPGPSPMVVADRPRLEQVLANLLDNAIKYTERGRIMVRTGVARGRAWCEVEDTGTGIPAEDQPRIFERFYRVDKARSREKGGTGLGLSIVKHIVSLHGGEMSVRSLIGQGSTFRFEIPVDGA